MKILHVYKDFDPPVQGGMERHMALMCRYQRQWADVRALTCSRRLRTGETTRDATQIREVAEWGRFQSAPLSPSFPFHMKQIEADVIVVHVPNPTAEIGYLLSRPKAKLVVRYQSDIVRQAGAMRLYGPVQQRFLSKAAMILVASQQYLDTSPSLQAFRERCRVVPLGIVPEDFESPDADATRAVQERYGKDFVLFSGRHRYYKGLEYLVRAAEDIPVPVVIAGEGPERARMQALANELGVNKVYFPGALSHTDLVAHLHACSVFVFPSVERSEAFGISMLEAQACRKPVVATQLGTGVEFVNEHEKTGFNVPPRDPRALAARVNELLTNEEMRGRMGEYARQRVRAQFDAERIAAREFELYQEVIS